MAARQASAMSSDVNRSGISRRPSIAAWMRGAKRSADARAVRRVSRAARGELRGQALGQLVQVDAASVSGSVLAQRDRALLGLALADDRHVGDLAKLGISDLAPDRLRARIELDE